MASRLKPLPVLEGDQKRASDPSGHASLSASAGTGKTQVLTARVLRLLIGGVAPEAILCLTFTKAGAAEMANRLGERLASWVRLDDRALEKELFALDEGRSKPDLERARRLFARVIEAPGGLRIQTIHGFAQSLLAFFPAEAGISPGFEPIEGRAEAELARRTLAALLADAEAKGDAGLIADVQALSLRLGEQGAESYLLACAGAHDAIAELGDPAQFEDRLKAAMGLPEGDVSQWLGEHCSDGTFDCDLLRAIAAANSRWGKAEGLGHVRAIETWLAAPSEKRVELLSDLARVVIKADGQPRSARAGQQKVCEEYPQLCERLYSIISEMVSIQVGAAFAAQAAAGLRAGSAFAAAYARAKRAAGVADFDDLIRWTRGLLEQPGMGPWIRFKLDQRTDHVLVDEAQDTNADQWAIVRALVEEFFSGSAEIERRWRTLFMVGDYKQAIFGFQGTDPREFETFRRFVAGRATALEEAAREADFQPRPYAELSINASFRSSPVILDAVDAVIAEVGSAAMGLVQPPERHRAAHSERPGQVELWPPFEAGGEEEEAGEEGWIDEPARMFADRIAQQVERWLAEAPRVAATGRPLQPGDILILVRSRTELAALVVARLFARRIPVAGIDRLHLAKPLAVRDLLSAIAFAVQPHDDLNLAGLLVSPLIGWDQQRLYDVAYGRTGSLWDAIQARRDADSDTHAALLGLLAMADYVTPARFLETILSGPLQGRRRLLARLGEAARDPIEELVALALEFEKREIASLDRFLAWFAAGDVEVKRDPSASGNAVRVMTVHGAKGLEAPFVILADATHDPAKVGGARSIMSVRLGGAHPVPLVRPRADERVSPFAELIDEQKARDLEEHWRLLYVALTRAQQRLAIAGVMPNKLSDDSWHVRAGRALMALGAAPVDSPLWGSVLRWSGEGGEGVAAPARRALVLGPPPRPDWLDRPAPEEERPPRPLSPSALIDDGEPHPPPSEAQRAAALRGTLLHSLFERLPAVAPARRRDLALRWLASTGLASDPAEEIATAACQLIADPAFAAIFESDALSEAPIAATLPDGRVIAGTVDRLCIADDRILVVDFKTGRAVPADAAAVPPTHRAQMDAYRAALRVIFPGRTVEAALLYTHGPKLIALDG